MPNLMASDLTFDLVMTEHPAWLPTPAGRRRVLPAADGALWFVEVAHAGLTMAPVLAGISDPPQRDAFAVPANEPVVALELLTALRGLGRVLRFRNGDLWDALGTAILRQVIRAGQSKRLYRAFCAAHGQVVELPTGERYSLFPSWRTVCALGDAEYAALGLAFKRRHLRQAAEAFGALGSTWASLAPAALVEALKGVRGIGAWTAGAAVADWSNDWALYPYADLAVRTWARRAAPTHPWPEDEAGFGTHWRSLAGEDLSGLTVLTLAWGSQHGDIG
jgi:DNA-3-methyladenine glycosylase II